MYILKSIQLMLCTCFDIDNYHNMLTADFYNHVVSLKVYVWEFQTCDFTENSITYIQFRRKWNKVIRISFIKYFACMLKSFYTFALKHGPSENDHFHKSEFWRAAAAAFFRSSFFSCNSIKSALKLLLLRLDSTSSSSSSQMTSFLMPLLLMLSIPKKQPVIVMNLSPMVDLKIEGLTIHEKKKSIKSFFLYDGSYFSQKTHSKWGWINVDLQETILLFGTIFAISKPILAIWTVNFHPDFRPTFSGNVQKSLDIRSLMI